MKVRAIRSFIGRDGDGRTHRYSTGDVFDLPGNVDWLNVGLVEPVKAKRETATAVPSERAVTLEEIDGIGPATARALADLGITTMRDLASAGVDVLMQLRNVDRETAEAWITQAGGHG